MKGNGSHQIGEVWGRGGWQSHKMNITRHVVVDRWILNMGSRCVVRLAR